MPESRLCSFNLKNGSIYCFDSTSVKEIQNEFFNFYGLPKEDYYLIKNCVKLSDVDNVSGHVNFALKLLGGKGGFGSMLRAIGAQIEKTTNREACRDLSGRRLRDINEEKRLKHWIAQQAEREKEAAERKKKKLERLCKEPKHDFKDETYDKERSELADKVNDSVEEGFKKAGSSGTSVKRTLNTDKTKNKKKKKLWIDADDDLSSTDSDDCGEGSDEVRTGVTACEQVSTEIVKCIEAQNTT